MSWLLKIKFLRLGNVVKVTVQKDYQIVGKT